jgi:hypothetical protein
VDVRLSIGSINRFIRKTVLDCEPIVDGLIDELRPAA